MIRPAMFLNELSKQPQSPIGTWLFYLIVLGIEQYSELPNSSGVPNKCMVAYNFFDLLHKNARFWSFLAYFWFKINSRGATTIRQCRVNF